VIARIAENPFSATNANQGCQLGGAGSALTASASDSLLSSAFRPRSSCRSLYSKSPDPPAAGATRGQAEARGGGGAFLRLMAHSEFSRGCSMGKISRLGAS